jgi:hypothetical protein
VFVVVVYSVCVRVTLRLDLILYVLNRLLMRSLIWQRVF